MRILVIDDHVLFREGLASIIGGAPDIEVVGLGGSVREAVDLARALRPDIILMDFCLPDGTGADATRVILAENPECKIVFLTIYEDDDRLFSAIRSGAKGYLLKNISPGKLVAAMRSVQQGESALSRVMTGRLMQELSRSPELPRLADNGLKKLTQRELDVLRELAAGASNTEISQRLFLAENTVKHHLHSIFEKLDLPDRRSAAEYARQHGLMKHWPVSPC